MRGSTTGGTSRSARVWSDDATRGMMSILRFWCGVVGVCLRGCGVLLALCAEAVPVVWLFVLCRYSIVDRELRG